VNISGIHCHIGSQITQIKPFALMAKVLAQTARKLLRYGLFLNYIDIGGGLGVNYKNETPPSPEKLANTVLPQIKNHCQTVIMEPGRYIVAESGVLVAKVLYRKPSTGKNFIIADAGMTDLIRPTLYGAYHEIIPVIRKGTPDKLPVDVVGPVCESGDFLGKNRQLPFLKAGDYIAVMNTGAYGFAMSSQYNSRPRAAEVLVDGKIWKIIRQRETYGNL
ncbi:MAG: diaminopimelate decarboxylase, partial [Elusimicrobiota bacterium]